MTHELKTWPEYFDEIYKGCKHFELRKNDRDFQKEDVLILREYDNMKKEYTGKKLIRTVDYILHGGSFGLEKGFVIMSISPRV